MESHLEARLWNDVFVLAQNELGKKVVWLAVGVPKRVSQSKAPSLLYFAKNEASPKSGASFYSCYSLSLIN